MGCSINHMLNFKFLPHSCHRLGTKHLQIDYYILFNNRSTGYWDWTVLLGFPRLNATYEITIIMGYLNDKRGKGAVEYIIGEPG